MPLSEEALARLADELKKDPNGRGYPRQFPYSYDDIAAAHRLLVEPVAAGSTRDPVSVWMLKQRLILLGIWAKLEAASTSHVDSQVRVLCRTVLGYLNDTRADTVDLDHAGVVRILDSLLAGRVINEEDYAAIGTMADTVHTAPYCAVKLGLPGLTMEDVRDASTT